MRQLNSDMPPTNSEGRKCKACGSDRTIILRWPDTDYPDEHVLACIQCGHEEKLKPDFEICNCVGCM